MAKNKSYVKLIKGLREGLIIGGIVGLAAGVYVIQQGADLNTIANAGKGLLDSLMSREAPLQIAKYKVYGLFTIIGSFIGATIDYLITKFVRKKR